jgi:type II secretory pathway predicted ATPase ExeA/phage tail protein X
MYYKHFNLSGPPFQFTPSAEVLYPSKSHREALAALEWGLLHEASGLTLLIGEPGTGKTTLISSVLARHPDHVRIAYIANPRLSFDEILQIIARQLGIAFNSPQRLARLDALDEFLSHSRNERVTVIIDESQVLPDRVLEELRLLSNYTPIRPNSLRFIFVGQPEFLRRLESSSLRQLNERIGARAMLNALRPNEIQEYIDFRLRARNGSAQEAFSPSALKIISDHSGGIPRRINVLCHNAMLLAYTSDSKRVRGQHAKAAAAEYEDLFRTATVPRQPAPSVREKPRPRWWTAATLATVGAVVFGISYVWSSNSFSHRDRTGKDGASSAVSNLGQRVADNPLTRMVSASQPAKRLMTGTASASTGTTLAPAPPARESHPSPPRLRQIRVRLGDTVENIARRYLGSSEKIDELIAANPQLANVDRIFPGDVIYLPQSDSSHDSEQ